MKFYCYCVAELPDKPILLPQFVESGHCIAYHLTRKGRSVADRVVCVLGYAHPEITYSPAIYPVTAILLHYMTGKLDLCNEKVEKRVGARIHIYFFKDKMKIIEMLTCTLSYYSLINIDIYIHTYYSLKCNVYFVSHIRLILLYCKWAKTK
jgi:hypothetical protein